MIKIEDITLDAEENLYKLSKELFKISQSYDHDSEKEKLYSEICSRLSWLISAVADNAVGATGIADDRIIELADALVNVAKSNKTDVMPELFEVDFKDDLRRVAFYLNRLSMVYDHDEKEQALYSYMCSRSSWLLDSLADNSAGKTDDRLMECAEMIQEIAQTYSNKNVRK